MANLLVELGTEELPSGVLDVVYAELPVKAAEALKTARLSYEDLKVEATPRRIALFVSGLAVRQADEKVEISGPSLEKAYAADGKPTPALEGFLKSKGAAVNDLTVKETPRGKFVVLLRENKGRAADKVLPELLQALFGSVTFPKNMRWEPTGFRFPRPARWLVTLLDKKPLAFTFAGLKASNQSYGHRFLAPKAFRIPSADWDIYKKLLKKAHVALDLAERKAIIAKGLKTKFQQASFDEELLHTTAQLVEEPELLQGSFSKDYLQLPKEVLASCMKKNQKIFACYDSKGALTGKFVAVLNGRKSNVTGIRAGYENVLESRLKDAKYFYTADTKEKLEAKLPKLEQVTYLGKLGNMRQKTERMEKLAEKIAALAHKPELTESVRRAARLSKVDLMTHLVYEFPDLQGTVGREYALASGESQDVAKAIASHYLPKSLTQDYAALGKEGDLVGGLVGIIDRIDLLVGAFGTGLQPTGSQDPFALRRAGGAVVKTIRAWNISFSVADLMREAAALYGNALTVPAAELADKLMKFFEERVIFELQLKPGTRPHEIFSAVWQSRHDNFADVLERFQQLSALFEREPENFIRAGKVVERTSNIVKGMKGAGEKSINPELLKEPLEKKLFELLEKESGEIDKRLDQRHFEDATRLFGKVFYGPIHDFFEQVMVNVEDTNIRENRQALMKRINHLYTKKLADLSMLSRLD
ncbi:MAG TPA: glycine--tRNA ligase subunit beta [Verrucomicrobiae bacterium]|nr:glycine--tRNA ligase subunit beta [Verrucomicrobiae bacterium]